MPDANRRALAREAIADVFASDANEATSNGTPPLTNLQAMGYNIAIPANEPNDTPPLTNLQANGYNVAIPVDEPNDTPPLTNLQANGYNIAIPANKPNDTPPPTHLQAKGYNVAILVDDPAPDSLGYSSPVMVTAADNHDESPAAETSDTDISSGYVSPRMEAPRIPPTEELDMLGYSEDEAKATIQNNLIGYVASIGKPESTNNGAPATGTAKPVPATGLRGKQLGDKYVGEEKGEGWRKNMKHKDMPLLTEHFSAEKKNQSTVKFDTEGQAANADGTLDGQKGFVVDPTTGNMHVFTENDARIVGNKVLGTHHSSPLSGKEVAGAGMVTLNNGQITNISDQSGHYKPEAELTFQTVQHLDRVNEASNGQSPLLNNTVNMSGRGEASLSPELKKLIVHLEKIESEIDDLREADQNADVRDLEEQARQIRDALIKAHVDLAYNKEATVTLLGKAGMLTDDEYRPIVVAYQTAARMAATEIEKTEALEKFKNDVNRASALKQLQVPLGEAEYAKLLLTKRPKAEGETSEGETSEGEASEGAIEQAMRARNIAPGSEGAAKRLKAALGAEAVANIKDDAVQITQLSAQYGVVASDTNFNQGSERVGFEIGQKSATTLTTQQFLQTGGNEAQIRTKQRLMSEIQPNRKMPGPKVSLKPTPPVGPDEINPKQEMQGADASTETPDAPDGATNAQSLHPAASRLLKKLKGDLASQKASLETALEKLDASIAIAEQPDNYTGEVDAVLLARLKAQKATLLEEMDEVLTEMARDDGTHKQGGSNADPPLTDPGKPGTGGQAPSTPPTHTAAEREIDDQWLKEQDVAKKQAEQDARMEAADAQRLELLRVLMGGKIKKMIAAGLSAREIHWKLSVEEHMSHEDIDRLGFPG